MQTAPLAAGDPPAPPTARSHRLANGMVLVGEATESFESAAFSLLTPAGCRHDPDGRAGLAALTCEMVLRGAGERDARRLVTDLDALGVERGETVGVSQASMGGSTLADNLPAALAIYADLLRRPRLPEDQLEAGRQVCLHELHGVEDEPAQKLTNELRRRHYADPWGRPSQGDADGIAASTIDDVARFHAERYRPDGAILAVAGRFDWGRLVDEVERLFGDWERGATEAPAVEEPRLGDGHVDYDASQSHLGVAFPSTPYRHPDYFQAWTAVGVLSGGMSSRLFTEVREKRGLCYTVYASLQSQVDRAAVVCYAGTTAERAQETLDVLSAEIERLAEGVTPAELDRLKARIKSALILQQESTASRASSLARDWRHLGRVRPIDELRREFDAVTADTVNAYLRRDPPRDFTVVTLGRAPLRQTQAAG